MRNLFVILVLMMSALACHEDSSGLDAGVITGEDHRFCQCCGGDYIMINSVRYRFNLSDIPAGHNFVNLHTDAKFPISVYVKWMPKKTQCVGDEILVYDLIPG
jgi:hypothetical protein